MQSKKADAGLTHLSRHLEEEEGGDEDPAADDEEPLELVTVMAGDGRYVYPSRSVW